jgi:Amt family ammonium transporter
MGAAFIWAFGTGFVMFKLIDAVVGIRVSPEEESEGLDYGEHGARAYPDFQIVSATTYAAGSGSISKEDAWSSKTAPATN